MKLREDKGISMMTLIVTIILAIILSVVAINGSTNLIGRSADASDEAKKNEDNDTIRALLTYTITDQNKKTGVPLNSLLSIIVSDETAESGEKEYGSGFYLIPGGEEEMLDRLAQRTGQPNLNQYKNLSAPYLVDYDNGNYVRLEEFKFKGEK